MASIHDRYTRRHGLKKTYDIEYDEVRYRISLDGKVLKEADRPVTFGPVTATEATFVAAVSSIDGLDRMTET